MQSKPFPLGYSFFPQKRFGVFFRVLFFIVKHIWLNIGPAVRPFVSPSVRQSVSPLFKNNLACFEKCSTDFLGSLFYIVKHICLNIVPAVRPFVSPSVRPSVRQSFIQKQFGLFWKMFYRFFRVLFLHRKTYLIKYWTLSPSVRSSVIPSFRQSVSPSVIWICNPFQSRPQVPACFTIFNLPCSKTSFFLNIINVEFI